MGPRSMFPRCSSTTFTLLFSSRRSSWRRESAKPEIARVVATSGPAKGADREDEIEGYAKRRVLLLLRRVRRGRKACAIRMGERRRVLTVSAHDDGGMVATGPAL